MNVNKNKAEIHTDCSTCDYKYVSYGESDTGYEEWSCELLDGFSIMSNSNRGNCPYMYGMEKEMCPLAVRYSVQN